MNAWGYRAIAWCVAMVLISVSWEECFSIDMGVTLFFFGLVLVTGLAAELAWAAVRFIYRGE